MWPFSKLAQDLTEADLVCLVDDRTRENIGLEYTRDMYARKDPNAQREMLRDISSIANAEGGALIIGMDEDGTGTAKALVSVPARKPRRGGSSGPAGQASPRESPA